jgi:hypothetical protein
MLMFFVVVTAPSLAATTAAAIPRPGKLVDWGGCKPHWNRPSSNAFDQPTVVLEKDTSGSADWFSGQWGVSTFARACSFARSGTAAREVGSTPRSVRQPGHELHNLQADAEFKGPYFLLGHSFDGIMLRNLPVLFPNDAGKKITPGPAPDREHRAPSGAPNRGRDATPGHPTPTAGATAQPAGKKPIHPPPAWTLACAKSWPGWPCHIIVSHYPPTGS